MITFKDFPLHSQLLATLDKLGFTQPTEIQAKALPLLLDSKRIDFLGQAQTGTGKTLAFGIPLIQHINTESKQVQALIVAPTRELVVQIVQALRPLSSGMHLNIEAIYGGVSMQDQMRALKKGVHIVVGTPGRLNDHLRRKTLVLSGLQTLVLDEADIMLDMGFKEEIDEILAHAPSNRRIWLFSATIKSGVHDIMNLHMKDAQKVCINKTNVAANNTKQFYCVVSSKQRFAALCRFIDSDPSFYGFILCQTKILAAEVAEKLSTAGYSACALHGDMSQALRNSVIKKFKNREFSILVATDVAARGIDVSDTTHVINYSLPQDHESYVHRIGRTGRAGKDGIAITFIGNNGDVRQIKFLEKKFKATINAIEVPNLKDIQAAKITKVDEYLQQAINEKSNNSSLQTQLESLMSKYSSKQLETIVLNSLIQKFFPAIKEATDESFKVASVNDSNQDLQEVTIHLGTDDNIYKEDILALIKAQSNGDQIEKIKVIKRRSFITMPSAIAYEFVDQLQGKRIKDKRIRISLSEPDEAWPAKRSSHGKRPRRFRK